MPTNTKFDRAAYNRQYYAETKQEPAAYEAYLAVQREKKRRRTIKKQDKLIMEAAKRMFCECYVAVNSNLTWEQIPKYKTEYYITLATVALYPERTIQNAQ